jgi:signal transduction histidine kinase
MTPLPGSSPSPLPRSARHRGPLALIPPHPVLRAPILRHWVLPSVVWCCLIGVCAGVAFVLRALPPVGFVSPDLWLTAILLLVGGASFRWLSVRLLSLLDRLIFKDTYDFRESLQQLSTDLSLAGDLDPLAESLPETLRRLMHLRFVVLLIYEGGKARVRGAAGSPDPALLSALVGLARPAERELRFAALTDDGPSLLVPLRLKEGVVGSLCLGPKIGGEPFRSVDLDLLTTLSGHMAALVHNAYLTEVLRLKVRTLDVLNDRLDLAREEERAHLAADLHDEPLQTALYLDRQLRNGRAEQNGALAQLSRALAGQLRDICKGMRPAALDDLGLQAALDMLTSEMRERSGIPITLDVDALLLPGTITPAIELTLYRAAQEAVNNALRHADARAIGVNLRVRHDCVELAVTDDGAGFTVPEPLERQVIDGHLGLASLQQRVRRANGLLTVESMPGRGTTVRIEVPLTGPPV